MQEYVICLKYLLALKIRLDRTALKWGKLIPPFIRLHKCVILANYRCYCSWKGEVAIQKTRYITSRIHHFAACPFKLQSIRSKEICREYEKGLKCRRCKESRLWCLLKTTCNLLSKMTDYYKTYFNQNLKKLSSTLWYE